MKALVLRQYNQFCYEDVPLPEYGKKDVLIKVRACAICGSDVHGMDGSSGRRQPPIIMGHEAAGEIAATGSEVKSFRTGDRVTFDSTIYCGHCHFCRKGMINLCDNRRVLGVSCDDYRLDGAMAEYVAVPEHILYALPDVISFEQASMVEPLSIAMHALRRSKAALAGTAAVIGTGMIGLLVIQLLRLAGCRQIIGVDIADEKLELAARLGATSTFNSSRDDVRAKIRELTTYGADAVFEVLGFTETVRMAVDCTAKGGCLTLVGNLRPWVELPLQSVVTREISLNGTCGSNLDYPDCLELIAGQKVDINAFISAVAPLSEGNSWFRRLYAGEPGLMKVILKP